MNMEEYMYKYDETEWKQKARSQMDQTKHGRKDMRVRQTLYTFYLFKFIIL